MTRHRRKRRFRVRSFYLWHRYMGLTVALLVIVLATTGLMLNHTDRLDLGSRHLGFGPLLDWYGIDGGAEITSFKAGPNWVSCVGDVAFLERQPLPVAAGCPVGALSRAEMSIVVTVREVVLLNKDGALIERLGRAQGVPEGMTATGTQPGGAVVVNTPHGLFVADRELLQWQPLRTPAAVDWSRPTAAPPGLREALLDAYRGRGLSVERFVLDLHSGRLFGRWGPYFMDAAAVVCLILALSGFVLWLQSRRKRRLHEPPVAGRQ